MKNINQKPQSPGKSSIFQTGSLKNRANSPPLIPSKPKVTSPDRSLLDESRMENSNNSNNSKWQQTTEIQIKNSFQAESNLKETIEQLVQTITLKIKQQETEQFIKELNNPTLTQEQSAALYLAPLEKSGSSTDFFGKVISQETRKAKAIKQFMMQQFTPPDPLLNQSMNTSVIVQNKSINTKPKNTNGGSPQKFQAKIASQQEIDQKQLIIIQAQIKTLEQAMASSNTGYQQIQESLKKQYVDLQNQINLQTSKILQLDQIFNKIEKEQQNEKQILQQQQQQQQKNNEKQEQHENTSNQEVQKQLQLVMRNLNSLAEHQQQQMMILKTALMTELKNDFLPTLEYKLQNQEIQSTLTQLKEQVKQTQQQNQETLIRKQQKIESLNIEIKNLMQVNKEKNDEIDLIKKQNDAIIEQIIQNKEEITNQHLQISELFQSFTELKNSVCQR